MQDPVRRFGERTDDDAGIRRGLFDNARVSRPAGADQASARSETSGGAHIHWGIADDKTICRIKLMLGRCAIVKQSIRFLTETRFGKAMRAYIRADNDGTLQLKLGCETREPDFEL